MRIFAASLIAVILLALASPSIAATPTGWWKLDESTGTTATDSSGNSYSGTLLNGGTALVWMPTSGVSGGAINFNSVVPGSKAMRIEVPTGGLSISAGTIGFWTKLTEPQYRADGRNGTAYLFGCGIPTTTNQRINLLMNTFDTQLDVGFGAGNSLNVITLSTTVWYHLALVWNGSNYYVYVNGNEVANGAASISTLVAKAVIGNRGTSSFTNSMDGLVDDVRFYNVALTADQIYGLYGGSSNPSPASGSVNVPNDAVLSWTGGDDSTSRHVYFSTANPPAFVTGTTSSTYDPGGLSYANTYYWRIDEIKSGGFFIPGKLWSFSTMYPPAAASNPVPADGMVSVEFTADLYWTAGAGTVAAAVYFGTTDPPPFVSHQTATSYDTGTMSPETTYYWRINGTNAAGTTVGAVWSFTTASYKAAYPAPPDGAAGVSAKSVLGWTAGAEATSHDIYFGSTNSPPFAVNVTVESFEPPSMAYNTTYYWRIDEHNPSGVAAGPVWSFTTMPPPPPEKAFNPSPANLAVRVSPTVFLSWSAGSDATSHNIYFGTVSPPPYRINQDSTTYNPAGNIINWGGLSTFAAQWLSDSCSSANSWCAGADLNHSGSVEFIDYAQLMPTFLVSAGQLQLDTTYYWRIDEAGPGGQTEGSVWQFTTATKKAANPAPASGAVEILTSADLSWTAGYGATSHYVYFGTANPLTFKTTRTAANYDPGTMSANATYYWRIDEKDSGGAMTTGDVWSFKTEKTATAKYPNPADGAYDVPRTADLRWTAGSGATSFNVYFGTSKTDVTAGSGDTAKGTQAGTMYNLGKLPLGTKYYWRIDDNPVWEFTTLAVQETETLAFPGAGGPGKHSEGGRGGIVLKVTSLNDSGTGSFRDAIEDYRGIPRTIVFDVAGYINLSGKVQIQDSDENHITIAGQTAPGGGVCVKGGELKICRDAGLKQGPQHVIIRHMRFRPGGGEDCVGMNSGTDVIFDHCSFSWSIDEAFSITQNLDHRGVLDNITVQWCIVAEPLNESWQHWDPKEKYHGFCSLVQGGHNTQYTYHHNLYANALDRMPRLGNDDDTSIDPDGWLIDWRNNVVYNWGRGNAGYTDDAQSITHQNFVNNYYLTGPDSQDSRIYKEVGGYNLGYYGGNWMDGILAADQWALVTSSSCRNCPYPHLQSQQFTPRDPIATDDAPTAYVKVLTSGGATLPARDSADVRTVNGVLTDTGGIIDCVTSDPYRHLTGTAQTGTSNTITLAATSSINNGWFNGEWIEITGGTGQGQTRTITNYVGSTKVATVDVNWTVIPDSTSTYQLIHSCVKNAGGWPAIAAGSPRADADGDGMADEWEAMYSLSSSNASDRNLDPDNDGYTNLEEYLNNSDPKISDIVP